MALPTDLVEIRDRLFRRRQENKLQDPLGEAVRVLRTDLFEHPEIGMTLRNHVEDDSFHPMTTALQHFVQAASGETRVLHLFSGSGRFLNELASRNAAVFSNCNFTNIDLSESMMRQLKSALDHTRAMKHIRADVRHLPLPNGSVDFVLCHGGIRYLRQQDFPPFASELLRVLRGDGQIFISEVSCQPILHLVRALLELAIIPIIYRVRVRVFRCTMFYALYNHFHDNPLFAERVEAYSLANGKQAIVTLADLAGYKEDFIHAVEVAHSQCRVTRPWHEAA